MSVRASMLWLSALALAGCGSLLETSISAPQTYVLRLAARQPFDAAMPRAGSVLLQRPEAGPGLESNRIALLRSEHRFDYYAASLWASATPDLVETAIVDGLRAGDAFKAVLDDSTPFAPEYDLRCALRRFEADYSKGMSIAGSRQAMGGNVSSTAAPTVYVALECALGRHRDRALIASFAAHAATAAADDRLGAVVDAFRTSMGTVVAEIERTVYSAIIADEKARAAG